MEADILPQTNHAIVHLYTKVGEMAYRNRSFTLTNFSKDSIRKQVMKIKREKLLNLQSYEFFFGQVVSDVVSNIEIFSWAKLDDVSDSEITMQSRIHIGIRPLGFQGIMKYVL
jgi:hypothetical protein